MITLPTSIAPIGAADAPVPAELGEPTDDRAGDDEADEIAAGRAPDHAIRRPCPRQRTAGRPRRAGRTARRRCSPRRKPSAPPTSRTPNVWPVIGTGRAGHGDDDQRRQVDEQGPGDDEGGVADPGVNALADADGDEEVGDGEAALRGRGAVEPRDRERHLDSGIGGHACGDRQPESSSSGHSYWTARTMDSRLAMRAG